MYESIIVLGFLLLRFFTINRTWLSVARYCSLLPLDFYESHPEFPFSVFPGADYSSQSKRSDPQLISAVSCKQHGRHQDNENEQCSIPSAGQGFRRTEPVKS